MSATTTMIAKAAMVAPDLRLEYVESGDPNGPPVIFLHGVTDSWGSFEPVMERIPSWIHGVAISQRGHGNSSRPLRGYRMEDFSEDVVRFMDRLGFPRAVIVGHSMGGFVAQRFGIDHPERTMGLAVLGAAPGMTRNPVVREMLAALETMEDPIDPGFVRKFQASTLARSVDPAFFHAAVAESLKVPVRVWLEAFRGFPDVDHSTLLGRIEAPTIVGWGSCDTIFGMDEQVALRNAIPRARLLTYSGGGHAFHWEDAATFAADLTAFCKEVTQ